MRDALERRLKGKVAVVAVGNPLWGDDGVGPALIRRLRGKVPALLVVAEDGVVLRHGLRSEDAPDLLSDGPRRDDEAPETVVAVLLGRKDRLVSMKAYLGGSVADEDVMKPYWEKDQLARSAGAFTTTELLPSAWSRRDRGRGRAPGGNLRVGGRARSDRMLCTPHSP